MATAPSFNITSPYGERVFAQLQGGATNLLTIPNSAGTWNNSGAQYIRITEDSLHLTAVEPKVNTNIKHGTASSLARITGRKSGQWSLNAPIAPSGTQAVAPDLDPVLQNIFGGPGSVVTGSPFGNAWEYKIYDRAAKPMALFGFQHSQTTGHRFSLGSISQDVSIDFNGDILSMSVNGVSVGVVENESAASLPENIPLGGLSGFPAEPGSFTANGGLINAFGGTLTINGVSFVDQCDSFSLRFTTGQGLKGNLLDSAYPLAVIYGQRSASLQMGFINNDSSALAQLKQWSRTNIAVPIVLSIGSVAGYRVYVKINGVQLSAINLADSNGYVSASVGQAMSSVLPGQSGDLTIGFA